MPCDLLKQLTIKKVVVLSGLAKAIQSEVQAERVSTSVGSKVCEVGRAAVLFLAPLLTHCLTLEKSRGHFGFAIHYELETRISFSKRFTGSMGKPGFSSGVEPDGFIIWALCTRGLRFWHVTRWNIVVSAEFCFEFLGSAALLTYREGLKVVRLTEETVHWGLLGENQIVSLSLI